MNRHAPWLKLLRVIPKVIGLAIVFAILISVGWVMSLFGHRDLLERMTELLRKWRILPPKTDEERAVRLVARINVQMTLWGFTPTRFLFHLIWRITLRPIMGHFLEDKLREAKSANIGAFAHLADTEMVVGATSMLDKFLAMALIIKFSGHLSKTQYNHLFEGAGAPLQGFANKIKAASALGLMVGDMQHDFTILRKLRNDFAHSMVTLKLSNRDLSQRCLALKMNYELAPDVVAACSTPERQKFMESVAANMLYLSVLIQRGIVERKILQTHFSEVNKGVQDAMKQVRQNAAAGTAT